MFDVHFDFYLAQDGNSGIFCWDLDVRFNDGKCGQNSRFPFQIFRRSTKLYILLIPFHLNIQKIMQGDKACPFFFLAIAIASCNIAQS